MSQLFTTLDWVVLGVYFGILLLIAFFVVSKKQKDAADYFLAGRNMGWFVIGASIFASNIGSEHVVGLAGAGAGGKFPMLIYELHAWLVVALGWIFLPFYARSGVFTMPEFLEKRFNSSTRWFLSIFSLLAYVLTKISVTIYAGGVVISTLLDIPFLQSALLVVVLTGVYTILGGMRAVVYTETLQAIILLFGAGVLTVMGLQAVGGWGEMKSIVGKDYMDMWRPASDPEFPWPFLVVTSTIVGIWYWCTDQYIVQRALTARNITEGRRGTIFGGFLKLTPVFLFLIPGVIAHALKIRGDISYDTPDQAFPTLMTTLLPAGMRGLVAAGLMAALMSSLASVFNSCSTLFTIDIYQKLYPKASDKKLLSVGKVATVVSVIAGILWTIVLANMAEDNTLYKYLQSVQSYIAPPITAVFLLGIFSKRINGRGAMVTLVVGLIVAAFRLVAEIAKDSFTPGSFFYEFGNMNYLKFGTWFFLFSTALLVLVSLFSQAPALSKIKGLTFATLSDEDKAENKNTYTWVDIAASLFVILIVAYIMISFNGK